MTNEEEVSLDFTAREAIYGKRFDMKFTIGDLISFTEYNFVVEVEDDEGNCS